MSNLTIVRQQVQRLLAELQEQRGGVRIASLPAKQAQDMRLAMIRQLGEVLEELYKVRDAKQLAAEGQMHVYRALAALMRVREFNTWYVRGFSKRLMNEGITHCQIYRAAPPKWEPAECSKHENQVYPVRQV